jgi:hypothetical protein
MSSAHSGKAQEVAPPALASDAAEVPLLEKVLQETRGVCDLEEPADEADRLALREVARRYEGQMLTVDLAAELVGTIVRAHFPVLAGHPELCGSVSRQVAETLLEDPVAQGRLEALWRRLSGGVP